MCCPIIRPAKNQQSNHQQQQVTPKPAAIVKLQEFVNDNINSQRAIQARNNFHRLRFGNSG